MKGPSVAQPREWVHQRVPALVVERSTEGTHEEDYKDHSEDKHRGIPNSRCGSNRGCPS
ncbi:hypothetical protein SPHINGOT1_20159 [Sphingomonas sp. T1]|nr:hypothetical protein SPHINGOT1_20159 [Sphingomonas sp. T1]